MSREKRYESRAEQQRAYRERKAAAERKTTGQAPKRRELESGPERPLKDVSDRELRERAAAKGLEIEVSDEPISKEEALTAAKLVPAPSLAPPSPEPVPLSADEEQRIRDRFDYTSSETRTKAERDEAAERMLRKAGLEAKGITEESYVAEQLALTRGYIKTLKPLVRAAQDPATVVDKTSPEAVKERLARAEKHARWRYRGFVAGEVASL
jgi:hypothetical protein